MRKWQFFPDPVTYTYIMYRYKESKYIHTSVSMYNLVTLEILVIYVHSYWINSPVLTDDLWVYGSDGVLIMSPVSLRNDMLTVG